MISDKVVNYLLLLSSILASASGYLTIIYDRKRNEPRVSTLLVIYSMLLAVICTITYQSTQFLMSDPRYRHGFKASSVNMAIGAIQGQVVLHTLQSSAIRRYQKRFQISELMREVYQLQKELFSAPEFDLRWMKLRILRKLAISQVIVVGSFLMAVFQLIESGDDDVRDELLRLCVFYYPKVTVICSVSVYYAVMMFVKNLHYALNERLKHLLREHSDGPGIGTRGYARTQHSVYIRTKLSYLADARYRIAECTGKMHKLYQQMMLSCNFLCMTFIVSQLYHFFEILYLHYRTQSGLSLAGLSHEALSCLICFFEVYSIAEACESVRGQSLKTQKLLLRFNLTPLDHKLKQTIEVFALQTLHQPVEFTASDMFTMDYTILFSIVASVTNYLIILIQFEMAVEN